MNIVKYLCEFFFCHFWHWCGLAILVFFITPWHLHIHEKDGKKGSEK